MIDEDGWPIIVDGTPGPWPDELSGENRRDREDLQDEVAGVGPPHGCRRRVVAILCVPWAVFGVISGQR